MDGARQASKSARLELSHSTRGERLVALGRHRDVHHYRALPRDVAGWVQDEGGGGGLATGVSLATDAHPAARTAEKVSAKKEGCTFSPGFRRMGQSSITLEGESHG